MFGFRLITIVFISLWGLVFYILRIFRPEKQDIHLRMITVLGTLLTFSGYFFERWVELDFLGYIDPTPELLRKLIPGDLISWLFRQFGAAWFSGVMDVFDTFTSFNGLTIHIIPTLFGFLWLFTLMPVLSMVVSFLTLITSVKIPGSAFAKAMGSVLSITSICNILGLLFVLPHLDAVGAESSFKLSLLFAILGAKIGNGPWVCIIGLFLMAVGGIIELVGQPRQQVTDDYQSDYDFSP